VPVVDAVTSPIPDNLQLIEGIGPKIAGILIQAGIYTYSDLANTSTEKLDPLLTGTG
jgi:predicted flap endonuclease-1-like 5' DNA nuclease